MKNRVLFIVVLIFVAVLPGISRAINNPVGPGTAPPSSVRSGLVRSPSPIDTSGNLVITGNVSGGRHFRGIVPYHATSYFWADTGSSSLDSFLRRSAGSGSAGRYTRIYELYYSPSRTVTGMKAGHSGVFRPPATKVKASAVSKRLDGLRFRRPMSMSVPELEKSLSSEVSGYSQAKRLLEEQRQETPNATKGVWERQAQMKEFWKDLEEVEKKAAELTKSLTDKDESLRLRAADTAKRGIPQPFELQRSMEPDVYEQMKWEINNLQKALERPGYQEKSFPLDEVSAVDLSARARVILGSHRTFASFSTDKFNQHITAAEVYLKEGKYYRAANAYTLASIYKPDDPLAYAGKSHALFAAGEYMSSALFLSRALEIFPEYAYFKVDIEAMVGDRDKLESRIVDVEQWLQRSEAAELQFLLGYIYYQIGRLEKAKEALKEAYEKVSVDVRHSAGRDDARQAPLSGLPDLLSQGGSRDIKGGIAALKKAIDDAVE